MARAHLLIILSVLMYMGALVRGAPMTSCSQLPYPEACRAMQTASSDPLTELADEKSSLSGKFRDLVVRGAASRARWAHQKLLSTLSTSESGSSDPRWRAAWSDCAQLAGDAVAHLDRALASGSSHDAQTFLSAAATNHHTCRYGFEDFGLELQHFTPFASSNMSHLISNSLAVNIASMEAIDATTGGNNRRRRRSLLSSTANGGGFPEWMSGADRKLLQAPGTVRADVVVARDGSGNFNTVSEAVAAASRMRRGNARFVIRIKTGTYAENIEIPRGLTNLMFVGDGAGVTVITGSRSVQSGATTFSSATVGVNADGFIARDITFENTAGPQRQQAVALRSNADFSAFYRCTFKGYQDTLYVHSLRQFYRDCDIYGTVDFIFGDAAVVLQNCNIYVRRPLSFQQNTITAQGRADPNENTGISIHNSRVTAAPDLRPVQGSVRTYLGRPWQKYSRTVFIGTSLDSLIAPAGWMEWSGNFGLGTLYYGEYMNTGPGASTTGRVKWPGYHVITSAAEAAKFTVGNFLGGGSWISAASIPFSGGL